MQGSTFVPPSPAASELVRLAALAFATRNVSADQLGTPRNLVYLSPDALDVDLSDPLQREFGDYELKEKIGRGGMGVVYRAHQRSLDREVALKLLVAGPWAPAQFIERFRSEAQSAARLEHPNIVTIYESGSQHELQYFSMRLVRGEALSTRLARDTRMAPREAARMLRIVAEAVDYAHRLGVLHLDLKPGNVLVDETGEPLVADFGLARRVDKVLEGGGISGTPPYMAPEQAEGRDQHISRATDVYGLGAVLYELLCGEPPFAGPTSQATLDRVLREEPTPLEARNARIPRDLAAICMHCLRKDPAARYPTAQALADDLRNFLEDRPVSVRQSPPVERLRRWARREPRFAAAIGGVALVLAAGLAATAQQWQRAEGNAREALELNWESRREAALQLEADGRGLEALSRLVDNLREQEAAGELEQADLERLRIGLLRGQGATLIDNIVVADANPLAAGVSTDGRRVALGFNDLSVRWYDAETLAEEGRISLAGRPTSDGEVRAPLLLRFIDDARLLVTLAWYGPYVSPTDGDSWLVDLKRGAVVEPPPEFADYADAAYSANGRFALLRDRAGRVQFWETSPWRPRSALLEAHVDTLVWRLDHEGRFAFGLGDAMRRLSVVDATGERGPREIRFPGEDGISAWALSADGRHLALGDFEGRVFLVDTETLRMRQMPALRGREITWLSFSEDDAWLAIANFDGLAQVLDVATGDLVVGGEMRAKAGLQRVAVSRGQRLIVAAGTEGETALWRIPMEGPRSRPAQRIGLAPAAHGASGRYAVDWSLRTGLLLGAGVDGQVRLWRLPASPIVWNEAVRQIADSFHASAERVVDVRWNMLRIVSPHGPPTRWIALDQPPGYAELLDDAELLLVTVGASVAAYDTTRLNPRYAPVELPATPERLLASADGRYVLLVFGGHSGRGHEEHLRLFDAHAGRWLPGEAVLRGPSPQLEFSPDFEHIVAVGPEHGVTTVLRREGLEIVAEFPHDPFEPVIRADFTSAGRVVLLTRAPDPRYGRESVVWWNPATDEIEARRELQGADPITVVDTGAGVVVGGHAYDAQIFFDGRIVRWPRASSTETFAAAASSTDGQWFARAFRQEVQLHERGTGALIGRPLPADINTLDWIVHTAFTENGLRARSGFGRDLYWRLERERVGADLLAESVARLLPSAPNGRVLYAPTAAERKRLRSRDPDPWPLDQPAPAVDLADNSKPGVPIPARTSRAPAELLDLAPAYDRNPSWYDNTFWNIVSPRRLPAGTQRFDGIDFDIRGYFHLGAGQSDVGAIAGTRSTCIDIPPVPIAALHVLAQSGAPSAVPTGELYGNAILRYRDGSESALPLRAGIELPGFAGDDLGVPEVFVTDHTVLQVSSVPNSLYAPRLANPHVDRLPRCVEFELTRPESRLVVFAVTVEPLSASVL